MLLDELGKLSPFALSRYVAVGVKNGLARTNTGVEGKPKRAVGEVCGHLTSELENFDSQIFVSRN